MFVFSIIALLCWSGSDLFSKIGSRQNDKLSHWKVGIAVGLVMGIHAIYEITIGGVPFTFNDIITYLLTRFNTVYSINGNRLYITPLHRIVYFIAHLQLFRCCCTADEYNVFWSKMG